MVVVGYLVAAFCWREADCAWNDATCLGAADAAADVVGVVDGVACCCGCRRRHNDDDGDSDDGGNDDDALWSLNGNGHGSAAAHSSNSCAAVVLPSSVWHCVACVGGSNCATDGGNPLGSDAVTPVRWQRGVARC